MGRAYQEWHVSNSSISCLMIHRRQTYCFWISLKTVLVPHNGYKISERWMWSQLEATFEHFLSTPTHIHSLFSPSHFTSTTHTPTHLHICVCVSASILFPQSLHGWIVAAAQLPATGWSSSSPSLYSLPSLRSSFLGNQSQPTPSRGKTSILSWKKVWT